MRLPSFALLALGFVVAGCSSQVPIGSVPLNGDYVGTVGGSDVWIAVHAEGSKVAVYTCGGATSFTTASRWYSGDVVSRHASLALDGWTVDLDLSEGHAKGTLTPPGAAAMTFDATSAKTGAYEGLYSALDSGVRTGVIVRQDGGGTTVVQGTWFGTTKDARAQVTPIKPVDATTFDVSFTFAAQTRTLTVKPFTF